jgi:hypothetical protein
MTTPESKESRIELRDGQNMAFTYLFWIRVPNVILKIHYIASLSKTVWSRVNRSKFTKKGIRGISIRRNWFVHSAGMRRNFQERRMFTRKIRMLKESGRDKRASSAYPSGGHRRGTKIIILTREMNVYGRNITNLYRWCNFQVKHAPKN